MSILQQFETPGARAIMRDPSMPDVDREDVIALFNGDLSDIRGHVQSLISHLANHQDIDVDLWRDLRDCADRTMQELDDCLCVPCLRLGRVRVARGSGFDERACDSCLRLERAL